MSGSAREVFVAFLRLGLVSFGGPLAHVGYFRREFVERRHWVAENVFAELLTISQLLPGPASSQLGFGLGLVRAGWSGGLAAFAGFTLPSALLMIAFAGIRPQLMSPVGAAAVQGLSLVAVAVVTDGLIGMARRLCNDWSRASIAVLVATIVLTASFAAAPLLAVLCGALCGLALCRDARLATGDALPLGYGRRTGASLLIGFATLLALLPWLAAGHQNLLSVIDAFYRVGALVFGGGHVVLPLLEQNVVAPGWITHQDFMAGYGAAQALPGPMFTLAAYLGARLPAALGGAWAAPSALLAIFLPGLLLIAGVLPFWRSLVAVPWAARLFAGVNAAAVGLLAAALCNPVLTHAIHAPLDVAIATVGWLLLRLRGAGAWLVVPWCVVASVARLAWGY